MKKLLGAALAVTMSLTCAGALAGCGEEDAEAAKSAISAIRTMYIDKYTNASTTDDFTVVGQYPVDGTYYTVNWSVNVTEGVTVKEMDATTKTVTIDVNERTTTDIAYELTASVTVGKKTETCVFKNMKVPAFVVNTYAEFMSLEKDSAFRALGVVTGFAKKDDGATRNCIYFQDDNGGYYAYNVSTLPAGLAIGDEITVSGTLDEYSGNRQLKDTSVRIMQAGKGAVTPKDITDVVKAATGATDKTLTSLTNQLVTIKGAILHNNTDNDSYFCFKLGKVDSYIRISSSDCPTGKTNQDAIKKDHKDNLGKTATITGVVTTYSGAFYLVPVGADAFKDFAESTATPEEKIAAEKEAATLEESITGNGEIKLPAPTTYTDVTFSWASDNAAVVVGEGKLTVTAPATETDVKITLTIKCGEKNDTKEFTLKVKPATISMADEYKLMLDITATDKTKKVYFTGALDGNYGATTETASEAATVVVAEVEGGYTLKVGEKFVELNSSNKLALVDEATLVWKWDADLNTFTVKNTNDKTYYLGTYTSKGTTYETIGASETKYIMGENASKIGVSQFPVKFVSTGVKFDFSTITETAGKAVSAEDALTFFKGYFADSSKLTSVEVKNVYPGTGSGGAKPNTAGILKIGKSKDSSKLVLNFSQDVVKVKIKCHDFYKVSEQYPTTSDKISVNGAEQGLPYNATGDGEVLEFVLATASKAVTIESASRAYIYEIVVYFAE